MNISTAVSLTSKRARSCISSIDARFELAHRPEPAASASAGALLVHFSNSPPLDPLAAIKAIKKGLWPKLWAVHEPLRQVERELLTCERLADYVRGKAALPSDAPEPLKASALVLREAARAGLIDPAPIAAEMKRTLAKGRGQVSEAKKLARHYDATVVLVVNRQAAKLLSKSSTYKHMMGRFERKEARLLGATLRRKKAAEALRTALKEGRL
jgi:hypothetical protein